MTRRRRDDASDRDNNISSDVFRKLQIKVGLPNPVSIQTIRERKRDRNERAQHSPIWSQQGKSKQNSVSQDQSYRSFVPPPDSERIATVPSNSPIQALVNDTKNAPSTSQNSYPPKLAIFNRHQQIEREAHEASKVEPESPETSHTFSAAEVAPEDGLYVDDPDSTWSCPADTHSSRDHFNVRSGYNGSNANGNGGEKRHNFQNLVSDLWSRGRHRRFSPVNRDKGSVHTTNERDNISSHSIDVRGGFDDAREVRECAHGGSAIFSKHMRSVDKQGHTNIGQWLGKGVTFMRNNGNVPADVGTSIVADVDGSVHNIRRATGVTNQDELLASKAMNSSPHSENPGATMLSTSNANGVSAGSSLSPPSITSRVQVPANHRNVQFFGGRFPLFQAEGTSENGRSPGEDEHGGNAARSPWARRLDWKKGAGNVLRRVRSWNNLDEEPTNPEFRLDQQTNEELDFVAKLEEEVRGLSDKLHKSEEEIENIERERMNDLSALEAKMKRYWTLYSSLKVDQELLYRNAGEILHENQKILGYVESNYDYVISAVGSGRRRCPGLSGHFIGALRHLGDNSMEFVFQVVKVVTKIYAFFTRLFNNGGEQQVQ